jgi:carbon-monoxide dehydrogenase medium subunit
VFPASFEYVSAHSLDEAGAALAEHGGDARVLAGGQSLIPAMRFRLARPAVLVDINRIADLDYLHEQDGSLRIGALCRDYAIETSDLIRDRYALIDDVSRVVADPIVRHLGTVVGSICHNDPAGDWATAALASRAEMVVRGPGGDRVVPIDDFIVDSFETAVEDGEMAIEARFPSPEAHTSGAYYKIERKVGDFATASAAVQVRLGDDGSVSEAGVALAAAGPVALRVTAAEEALRGQKPSAAVIAAAGEAARAAASPGADQRGGVEYKKDMARVLVERALRTAFTRLGVEVPA